MLRLAEKDRLDASCSDDMGGSAANNSVAIVVDDNYDKEGLMKKKKRGTCPSKLVYFYFFPNLFGL